LYVTKIFTENLMKKTTNDILDNLLYVTQPCDLLQTSTFCNRGFYGSKSLNSKAFQSLPLVSLGFMGLFFKHVKNKTYMSTYLFYDEAKHLFQNLKQGTEVEMYKNCSNCEKTPCDKGCSEKMPNIDAQHTTGNIFIWKNHIENGLYGEYEVFCRLKTDDIINLYR
jgi:hypothetical protein